MRKNIVYLTVFLLFYFTSYDVWAAVSISEFARQLTGPVMQVADLVKFICRLAGVALIVTAFVKYFEYRRGVGDITIRAIVGLLLGGLAILGITFVSIQR